MPRPRSHNNTFSEKYCYVIYYVVAIWVGFNVGAL